jgi:hypothetical protein
VKNWKTTVLGAVAGVTQIAGTLAGSGFSIGHFGGSDWLHVIAGLGTGLLGLYAKDHDVTGGTRPSE